VGFNTSMQRHYRRLILLLMLLHVSVVRPSSSRNILLARTTVACVRSGDVGFNPSTQRHYPRLILLLILLHASVPSSSRNIVNYNRKPILILGCLHTVACLRSGDGFFYPSTQRHYRRLILLLNCYLLRSYDHILAEIYS
jgi:hypothetical protein